MNNIPDGWKEYRLEEIAEIFRGVSYKKNDSKKTFDRNYIPVLRANNIENGSINLKDVVYVLSGNIDEKQFLKENDILITMSSGSKSHVGKVAFVNNDMNFAYGAFCAKLRIKKANAKYVFYCISSRLFRDYIEKQCKGTNINNLKQEHVLNFALPLPSISEQQRIVAKIEELFSKLDAGIESLKKAKQQLAVYRQAVLKEAFVQKESKIVTLAEITDEIKIGPFGTMLHKEDYISDGIPVINPQHIKNGQIIPSSKISISSKKCQELASYKVKTNDVIMGRRGEMGRCAAITKKEDGWLCGTGSILFRLKSDFDACVYAKILSSPDIVHYLEKNATGTTMKNLNEEIVKNIPVPFITKQEQSSIVRNIESRLSVCDQIERVVNESLEKADVLRQSILKKAFEGGL